MLKLSPELKSKYLEYQDAYREKERIADILNDIDVVRSSRVHACGNRQFYAYNKVTGASKVVYGEYCDDRLCPLCQQALHRERASKLSFMVRELSSLGFKFYFWTFSPAPNCQLSDLKETCRAVINLFNRVQKKFFTQDQGCYGFWRTLEFTKHEGYHGFRDVVADTATYHPHIHAIFAFRDEWHTKIKTPHVKAVSKFMIDEINAQLKSKDKRYAYYKHLAGSFGIVDVRPVKTTTAGFSFELSKYISLSKNLSDSNLKLFSEQVADLQCHRSTGVLHWNPIYKADYNEFVQNANCEQFPAADTVYFVFGVREGIFYCENSCIESIRHIKRSRSDYRYISKKHSPPGQRYKTPKKTKPPARYVQITF